MSSHSGLDRQAGECLYTCYFRAAKMFVGVSPNLSALLAMVGLLTKRRISSDRIVRATKKTPLCVKLSILSSFFRFKAVADKRQ